jgi:hypothetical protein
MDLLNDLTANFEVLIVLLVVAGAGIAIAQQKKKKKKQAARKAPKPANAVTKPGPAPGQETATSTTFVPPPLDLNDVNWLHTNVKDWEETSQLAVNFPRPGVIRMNFADTHKWPGKTIRHNSGTKDIEVNANPWVFVYKNGQWHGATWEWLVVGNYEKNAKSLAGDHIKQSPLRNWRPKKGETVYIMVSALARNGGDVNVKARTNIVKVTWPDYFPK